MSEQQQAPATARPLTALKAFGIVAAIVVPLITAASITIPAVMSLSERKTSSDMLEIAAVSDPLADAEVIGEWRDAEVQNFGSYEGYREYWRIELDAPIETFPTDQVIGDSGLTVGCNDEQLAWLEQYAVAEGKPRDSFSITVRNSASAGNALALGNVRFLGEETQTPPSVLFACPPVQAGAVGSGQPFLLGVDGSEALYDEPLYMDGEEPSPVGSPVSINLSPGEVNVLTLKRSDAVDGQRSYEGSVVADLLDGSGKTVVLAEQIHFDRAGLDDFFIRATSGFGDRGEHVPAQFSCASPTFSTGLNSIGEPQIRPCTLSEAAEIMREAAAAAKE